MCLQTLMPNASASHSASVGARLGHDLALARIFDREVGRLHQQAAEHLLEIEFVAIDRLGMKAHHAAILFLAQKFQNSRLDSRDAISTSVKSSSTARANSISHGRLAMMMPPKGESGSVAKALSHAAFSRVANPDAAGRVVLENRNDRFRFVAGTRSSD